jgi:hypothetical protein
MEIQIFSHKNESNDTWENKQLTDRKKKDSKRDFSEIVHMLQLLMIKQQYLYIQGLDKL